MSDENYDADSELDSVKSVKLLRTPIGSLGEESESVNPIEVIHVSAEEFEEMWNAPSQTEVYKLALESVFRWTLRRDELSDAEIVRAIKKVTMVALGDI